MSYEPDKAIHPGYTVKKGLRMLGIPSPNRKISRIMKFQDSISLNEAVWLAEVMRTTPQFWLNLQKNYDDTVARLNKTKD